MSQHNAILHLDAALQELTGEVYRDIGHGMKPVDGICTVVWELDRIDAQLGAKGHSMFYPIARAIETAFVEITAARNELK